MAIVAEIVKKERAINILLNIIKLYWKIERK
jgi:hypothetical protein